MTTEVDFTSCLSSQSANDIHQPGVSGCITDTQASVRATMRNRCGPTNWKGRGGINNVKLSVIENKERWWSVNSGHQTREQLTQWRSERSPYLISVSFICKSFSLKCTPSILAKGRYLVRWMANFPTSSHGLDVTCSVFAISKSSPPPQHTHAHTHAAHHKQPLLCSVCFGLITGRRDGALFPRMDGGYETRRHMKNAPHAASGFHPGISIWIKQQLFKRDI